MLFFGCAGIFRKPRELELFVTGYRQLQYIACIYFVYCVYSESILVDILCVETQAQVEADLLDALCINASVQPLNSLLILHRDHIMHDDRN